MNSKQFNVIAVVTAALFVWAVVLGSQGRDIIIEFVRGQALVPDLDVDRVTRIEIKKGATVVQIDKHGKGYRVASRYSYPAATGRVNQLIQQCTGITCGREITDAKDAHDGLEVDPTNANAILVRFLAGDEEIVGVVVGKSEGAGNYVRLHAQNTVYLSQKSVFLDTDALNFIDKEIGNIANLETVEVTGGEERILIKKSGGTQKLMNVPEGMVEKSDVVSNVFTRPANLTFSDFYPESDAAVKDVAFKKKLVATTESKEQYTFHLGTKGEDYFVKVSAKDIGTPLTKAEVEKAGKDPEILKRQEARLQAGKKCAEFVQRHQSWVYKIAKTSGEELNQSFQELIEEDRSFFGFDTKEIASVTVQQGEDSYTIESPKAGEIKLVTAVAGKKPKPFVPDTVLEAVSNFDWTERVPPNDKQLEGLKYDVTYTLRTRDGQEYALEIGKNKDNRYYVKPVGAYKGAGTDDAAKIAQGAVAKFNQRHKGQIYEVPGGPVDTMRTPKADLYLAKDAQPEEIQASHILISFKGASRSEQDRSKADAKKLAEEILGKVKAVPADFEKLAKEKSDGPSKDKGGDLGRFGFATMAKPFSECAFKLEPGQLADKIVETEFGFHIIKRTK